MNRSQHFTGIPRYSRGFTLLEAIVALVLLTTAGLALFSWMNASFDGLNRIEQSNARAAAELNALEFMKTVNPMERPDGQIKLGQVDLKWRARQLAQPVQNRTDTRDPGPFSVAMYDVELTLEDRPKIEPYSIVLRQMGYRRLYPVGDESGGGISPSPPAPGKR